MMKTHLCIVAGCIVLTICSVASTEPFAKGPYLGQTPPGSTAQVFAPGLISDTRPKTWEAFGTFSGDGNTFCFHLNRGVFVTANTNQGWTAPKRIDIIRKNHPSAWSPCLSPDANTIYFSIGYPRVDGPGGLLRCNRTAHGWAIPQRLGPPLSSGSWEFTFSLAANNNVYLSSGREGKHESNTLFFAPFMGNTWLHADQIPLNHPANDPGIAPDESFMVFTAKDVPGGYGHRDLYLILRLPDGTWSKPQNLGPRINTAFIEHGPRISPDKKYLFFTRSNGWDPRNRSSADIYWVELGEYLPESYR
jgi:hypothetical protein